MDIYKYLPFRPYLAVFKELEQITDIASMTKEERLRYDESIKIYRDNLAVMEFAVNKAKKEGREEEKIEIARKLKATGIPTDIIAQTTGLNSDQISAL